MEFRRVLFRSQEDEDPLAVVARFLKDRKLAAQPIAIAESVRFFAFDGLRKVLPEERLVSANPVVRGCRMVKTLAELALMQTATDVTIAAYRWLYPRIENGMRQQDVSALMSAATKKDRKSTRLNSSHQCATRTPPSA